MDNHFQYSCAALHCAARCDRCRNADSVSVFAIVHYRSLSLTIAAQRSRSGNTLTLDSTTLVDYVALLGCITGLARPCVRPCVRIRARTGS